MNKKHGLSRTPEYACWRSIRARCKNPRHGGFKYCGARGITFCQRWRNFENFIKDVGLRPSPDYSIDRYPDNDGNYEPGNVRWATREQQQANTRKTRYVIFKGERMAFCTAYQALGIPKGIALARIQLGWSAQRAIDTPFRKHKYLTAAEREEVRKIKGISQDRIAELYGVSQSVISAIRLGKTRDPR